MKTYENQSNTLIGSMFTKQSADLIQADILWKAKQLDLLINCGIPVLPAPFINQYPVGTPVIHPEPVDDNTEESSVHQLMLASEDVLAKEWDKYEEDKAWEHLARGT